MQDQGSKPFAYLRSQVKHDLEISTHIATEIPDCSIEDLCRMALEFSSVKQRQMALWYLAEGSFDTDQIARITRELMHLLSRRFEIGNEEIAQLVAEQWFASLRCLAESLRYEVQRRKANDQYLKALAGPELERMQLNPERAEQLLDHSDPKLRRAAISILSDTSDVRRLLPKFLSLLARDQEPGVQMTLIRAIVACCSKSGNPAVSKVIAQIVASDALPIQVRDVAYQALFQINDAPVYSWPEVKRSLGDFQFPDDIDWRFVDTFINAKLT